MISHALRMSRIGEINRIYDANWYLHFFWKIERSAIIIIVRNYKYLDLTCFHGVTKYDNWLYKHFKKILWNHISYFKSYYKKIHIFAMHRDLK